MLNIERGGCVWDIQHVLDAVRWAYSHSQAEDETFAARNTAEVVQYSPLTRTLQRAYSTLLELEMWESVDGPVIYNAAPVDS